MDESMNVTLSRQGAELLRAVLVRHPEMSAAEILEAALAERFGREQDLTAGLRSPAEVRVWLDELAALSDKIPARQGETFSREMIYQDHA